MNTSESPLPHSTLDLLEKNVLTYTHIAMNTSESPTPKGASKPTTVRFHEQSPKFPYHGFGAATTPHPTWKDRVPTGTHSSRKV